jgi:hypothetical protein
MVETDPKPQIFNILRGDALEVTPTPYGTVGKLFSGEGLEAVWVRKQDDQIDPGWFSQARVDLILVVQGQLRVEFERRDLETCVLEPGELLVLPPDTCCRAYRWPRDRKTAGVFVAVYPTGDSGEDPT